MIAKLFHVTVIASLMANPAHAAVSVNQASVSWSYGATDSFLGLVGQGSSLGFVEVNGNVSEGAGPNLDPTATSVSVRSRTSTNPENYVQGIVSDEGGGVDGGIGLRWYATVVDPNNPSATGPVDITISGGYYLGIDGPRGDFNGAYDVTDGFLFLNAQAFASVGGNFLFSYDKTIGNDQACLPYNDPALCQITIAASDRVSVDTTVQLNSVIRLDLSATLSLAGGGDGNYGGQVRADPSIAFTNADDAQRYQIVYSGNLAPVPEPHTYALLLAGLGAVAWAARPRRAAS